MSDSAERERHQTIDFVGLRAHATAVGLIQLTAELVKAGVLDAAAVDRIKDAIGKELALSRPGRMTREEFARSTRARLDRLFSGEQRLERDPASMAGLLP
jgi:hypothetical protein